MFQLFSTADFTPRTACGPGWTPALQLQHEISDVAIFMSYILIPLALLGMYRLVVSGKKIPYPKLGVALFIGFISTCGLTHLMDRLMFQWPAYRLGGLVLLLCASFSITTVAWMLYAMGAANGGREKADS
jgi:hypothetical protein